jgi:serine/threonine protein kinase
MAADMPVDSFLDLLRQSNLLVDSQMLSLTTEFSSDGAKWENGRSVAAELVKRGILTEWQAENLLQGKHRGFRLGPHRILMPLGKGGMSTVYLAEHMMMRRRCAIKVLPTKYQEDPDLLNRFHLEARAIAALDHPHIVRAYDFNTDVLRSGKPIHYLVMEYVEGQDLRRMVEEQGPLDYRKAADFIRQAAEGLAHAHAAGFVHRDIKPANLLVDPNGVLKILDLGLALEGQEAWDTSEGQQSAVGTADYVAPEQVMDSRSVDGRADLYSLGYTFYFLLTGRRPFPKSTLVELLMAHRVESPEPIANLRPDAPIELIEIIERMTSKNPDLRFQTAKDVAERLQTWLHDSESRDYSRISALMAAAMRAKQAGSEGSPTKPDSTARKAEPELAFLDDEPATSAGAKAVENRRTEATKPAETDIREKPRKLSASDSGRAPALRPGDSGRTAALSRSRADLLLDMNAEPTLGTRPQYKHRSGGNNALKSPWLWIGLAVLICFIFLFLAVFSAIFSSSKPEEHPAKKLAQRDDIRSPTSPSAVQPPQQQQANAAESPEAARQNGGSSADAAKPSGFASGRRASEPSSKEPAPKEPAPKEPPPKKPSASPAEPAPTEKPPEKKENPPPPPPQPTKPAKISADTLLANLKEVSFHSVASSDPKIQTWIGTIQRLAGDALKSIHPAIEVSAKSPNVMEFELKSANDDDSSALVLTVELKCRAPDGSDVPVWKHSDPVAPHHDPATVRAFLRPNTKLFFKKFTRQVLTVRSKVNLD